MGGSYYSQYGEDFLVHQLFLDVQHGFYVDVGAFDGIHLSNSFAFEQLGWDGICVEPHPTYFPLLEANRPHATCVNAAIVGYGTGATVELKCEPLGLLSGIVADRTTGMEQRYAARGLTFEGFATVEVDALTLNELLDSHAAERRQFELLSLDTEGTELDILEALDFDRHEPRAIVVEANEDDEREALTRLLANKGYALARRLNCNLVFCRSLDDAEVVRRTRIRCEIADTVHPLGEKATPKAFRGRTIDEPD